MNNWKYTDVSNAVAFRSLDNGGMESCLAHALPAGAVVDAADAPTPAQIQATSTAAIQARLDNFARTRGYDGILSACTYASSTVPKFAAEGQYCVQARDDTWAPAYVILAAVEAGTRPMPTLAEVMAELPALVWPA